LAEFTSPRAATSDSELDEAESGATLQRKRNSFRLDLCYAGSEFCGWQRQIPSNQTPLPSVQQTLEDALATALQHKIDVRVSGRTDVGVHAIGQVAQVRTRDSTIKAEDISEILDAASNTSWRAWKVSPVSDKFHPTFGTQIRSYVYRLDACAVADNLSMDVPVWVDRLDRLLNRLQGQTFAYMGVSYGKVKTETTLCTLCRARAVYLQEDSSIDDRRSSAPPSAVIAIELAGDRFLRRMVRILVATAMVLAIGKDGTENIHEDGLLELVQAQDRRISAKAAPAAGLVFVGARIADNDDVT
jgi:tRNA pseudouridine38-40 synthase